MKLSTLITKLQEFEKVDPNLEVIVGGWHRGGCLSFKVNHVFTEFNPLADGLSLKISKDAKDR